jgi:hypothetical protein
VLRVLRLQAVPILVLGLTVPGIAGCNRSTTGPSGPGGAVTFSFEFAKGAQNWQAGFAEYRAGQESFMKLTADYRSLPESLGSGSALFISGWNYSDDLFMFYKRRVTGLQASATYAAQFEVEIATDVPHTCGGPGRPGEDVFLKAGATPLEPLTTIGSDGGRVVLVNVDQGVQANSGRNAVVLGTIENTVPCEFVDGLLIRRWELKTFRSTPHALSVQADDQGRVWLIVGTDSAFEAQTAIYYTRVSVTFSPQ